MLNYKNPFCYILVGPAAVGKSMVRKQLLTHPTMKDAVVVSTDDLVKEMAIARAKSYAEVFGWLNQAEFKRHVKATIKDAVLKNKNILVDRCNLTVRARSVVTNLIPPHYNRVMVVMRYEEEKVLANLRNNPIHRGKSIPIENVLNMFRVYQEPQPDEYDLLISQEATYG